MKTPSAPAKLARFAALPLVLCALALSAAPAVAAAVTYKIDLTGPAEVPPAPVIGHGTAAVTIDAAKGRLCYALTAKGSDVPTMAHIHKGAIGTAGDVVVPLDPPAKGKIKRCADVAGETLNAIVADPADYYVNIHTALFPKGAMRGQLGQ